ncbi:hypothetical protein [Cohnella nanjingensis]|uniref:Uncharacterized protein n=1 Tax=Cohnella nanjingensis TaxID=1387779 RepID=A0A7X0RLE0_9BACL|nr:hypothetical protein [Cohnella nanjingensis]MBB6669633.1 hypothetical protein [Cohnella nanjingensis]
MHLFELLFVWMTVVFVDDMYVAVLTLNLKWIQPASGIEHGLVRCIYLQVLSPLLVVWGMTLADRIRQWYWKAMLPAATGVLIGLVQQHITVSGVMRFVADGKSSYNWLESILLVYYAFAVRSAYRTLMRKDGLRI